MLLRFSHFAIVAQASCRRHGLHLHFAAPFYRRRSQHTKVGPMRDDGCAQLALAAPPAESSWPVGSFSSKKFSSSKSPPPRRHAKPLAFSQKCPILPASFIFAISAPSPHILAARFRWRRAMRVMANAIRHHCARARRKRSLISRRDIDAAAFSPPSRGAPSLHYQRLPCWLD